MRLLRGLSFHWGWFLRYKLSAATASPPILGPPPPPPPPPAPDSRAPTEPRATSRLSHHHAVRPQTPARHTAYPLSPTDSGGSGRLSVCYGVSRASYIFSGCITLHPRSPLPLPLVPYSLLPSSPPMLDLHPNRTGHLLPRRPRGFAPRRTRTKLSPAAR